MTDQETRKRIIALVRQEVVPAIGCTEPMAVALCTAKATEQLGCRPEHISIGSSCGITYLMGGDYQRICFAVKNMIANLTGMICDGAKPSCSLKITSGVSTAVLSA
jgi:L-cysteine desulfidase